jgi:hypothetical protein
MVRKAQPRIRDIVTIACLGRFAYESDSDHYNSPAASRRRRLLLWRAYGRWWAWRPASHHSRYLPAHGKATSVDQNSRSFAALTSDYRVLGLFVTLWALAGRGALYGHGSRQKSLVQRKRRSKAI